MEIRGGRKHGRVSDLKPEVAKQWHPIKNGPIKPSDLSLGSRFPAWWLCDKSHEWQAKVSSRCLGNETGCPFCANKMACADNCLATLYPELAKEWGPLKNGDLTPFDVLPHTHKKVWWLCSNNHSWISWISDRVSDTSHCSQCYGVSIRDRSIINTENGRICIYCHKELSLEEFRPKTDNRDGKTRPDYLCRECAAKKLEEYRKTDKGIAADIVRRTKYFCKQKCLPFDLDKEWVLHRLTDIDWRCELTGLPMTKHSKGGFILNALSTDRIIPSKGYTKDNVRFVLNQVNIFRQNGTDENMYRIAQALLDYRSVKK